MASRSTEVKVGISVLAAMAILIFGVLWIGEFSLNRRLRTYVAYFSEVGGLSSGDPVTVSGLEMGKVGEITLERGKVRTELLLEEEAEIRSDARVEIRSIGLMGEKFVYILPGGSGELLEPGAEIEGRYRAGLPEVVAEMGDIMEDVRSAADALTRLVSTQGEEYSLVESLEKLNRATDEIIGLIDENRADIRSTTRDMASVSGDLKQLVGERKDRVGESLDRFSSAASRLDSLTVTLQAVVASVERGEGSLGKLIREKQLYEEMERTLDNLNGLIEDIKEHPERYLKIEIF
jgi:phospholipid/cholesterol/gamma-HCH transport system substrate-binding protein